ncbi:hypothetical protein [Bradyrhizobium sp. CCH5-F6]|jgi:hypothetical protein|uniref:hypothetical protein n=1 Tax=Bradyrhizobium sp. CCH5-F6 TaxID=1768753 RepID=UPI000A5E82D5|nr:hypothetical protein [Bradyrhizobium sp. CCH5-F6]
MSILRVPASAGVETTQRFRFGTNRVAESIVVALGRDRDVGHHLAAIAAIASHCWRRFANVPSRFGSVIAILFTMGMEEAVAPGERGEDRAFEAWPAC